MHVIPLKDYNSNNVIPLLMQIPLFADLADQDKTQFDALLFPARVIELDAGEVIIEKGERSQVFYVLLKGQLDVFGDNKPGEAAISQLSAGQLFGTLAALSNVPRTATLASSRDNKATLLAIDFSKFGDVDNFNKLSLTTKLKLYRNVVNNTRWKLEIFKRNSSDFTLEHELSQYPPFTGEGDTIEELTLLAEQITGLATLLDKWNKYAEPSIPLPEMPKSGGGLSSLLSGMKNKFRSAS